LLSLLAMGVDSPFVIYFKTVQIQLSPWCSFRSPQNNLEMGTWGSWVDTTSWSLAPVLASRDGYFEQPFWTKSNLFYIVWDNIEEARQSTCHHEEQNQYIYCGPCFSNFIGCEEVNATSSLAGCEDEKTFRKWCWLFVFAISWI
jgi:hypothetical protein